MTSFASRIIHWQQQHGRHTLPWQGSGDPYRIWLSEIMLQQTQVATVIPYFERFIARFPDIHSLALASDDDVLALWSGLGYYSRARNLHAAARLVVDEYEARFPTSSEAIARLPGVGRSTAAAIAALAFGERCAILDGNVKRVLARHAGVEGWPGDKRVEATLWQVAEERLPEKSIGPYTQGMMDLGALVCVRGRPACQNCPVNLDCIALAENRTTTLPASRPRKALPEKHVQMLLLHDGGKLMLEKRESRGIWGGLWSLPELEPEANASTHCENRYGLVASSQQGLPVVAHTFTHFKLHIRPVLILVASRNQTTSGTTWLSLEAALEAALPAPVRKLVERLNALEARHPESVSACDAG